MHSTHGKHHYCGHLWHSQKVSKSDDQEILNGEIEKKANLQPITNFHYLQPHISIPCPGIIAVQTHSPAYTVAQRKIFKAVAFNSHT